MKATLKSVAAGLAVSLTFAGAAVADDFPNKPIELIVPYGAGGLTDAFARSMAQVAEKTLGQTIIVVNKPGGGATIGATAALTAPADGYTLLFTTSSPIVIQPHYGQTSYKPEDFRGIIRAYDIPISLTVRKDSELQTFDQWLEWVKAHPGEFTYGTSGGTGSGGHISAEQLALALGVEIRQVPFEGSAPLTAAVMGGQVMGGIQLPDTHNGGELHGLIFMSPGKPVDEVYKAIPTTKDLGIDAVASFFSGIIGNKDIPDDRIEILGNAFKTALEDPSVVKLLESYSLTADYAGPDDFTALIKSESDNNLVMLKTLKLID